MISIKSCILKLLVCLIKIKMTFQSRVHTSMVHPAVDMPITLCVTAFLQSVHCFFSLVATVVVVAAAVAGVVAFGELLLWEPYFL